MEKIKLATVWLAGCSGCHMSFLDLEEWLLELAQYVDVVYSPVGSDLKEYPENVDVCLVEGGIANEDNLELINQVRERSKILVSFGDCAVTANVPAMRNMLDGAEPVLKRAYLELGDVTPQLPYEPGIVPELLEQVLPVHQDSSL
ncbi:MAG: oxidoreductase [Moorea sp. SIO1G6]|uniref:Coenzyme F420-reducing hydrogenase, gamma subunit n=1 Tax=Moorena producens 3L TaxID=489825 RepID=F4Y471_9CYAN|nr:coenzyme F420-reducing hydrogenase, gamma subunit [Moorena producens 3L]NEP34014.1 oxidoreductase [Moorena sp. SIO3B2]NEP69977.1 oxidoreductase [Moorena sp. SIO3A5]NEQ11226.1 oxidoreductase [Moorena sp. SIO4E2]NEQ17884.1 oxidoreductase [Moorena sp. SIO3E2]NER91955.1 oxidoreductase [Moorena sp. SIO3A2]NES46146.1 oxidoreductase [Moorena sp. SIO2C4]NET69297.1 oxidoreductase [Moorena sp. SIO1G6]